MLLKAEPIADVIKQKQATQVKRLQAQDITPTLAIILANQDPASAAFVRAKQRYGAEVGVNVDIYDITSSNLEPIIKQLNQNQDVHGVIVQLPLPKDINTEKILNLLAPAKDVDGLGKQSKFQPAAVKAILWMLDGYKIALTNKNVTIVGQGRLVGKPLYKILRANLPAGRQAHKKVSAYDEHTKELEKKIKTADVIISATGQPGLIKPTMVKAGSVVIDAGTAEAGGKLVGDADPELYKRNDIKISPVPGGIGPLTVAALFDNLLKATSSE